MPRELIKGQGAEAPTQSNYRVCYFLNQRSPYRSYIRLSINSCHSKITVRYGILKKS